MSEVAFFILSAITILSAILALEAREIVYGAVSLALMFLGVAGFFVLLNAPFLAMFQIIIFVGAVAVLVLFTVMLVRREKWMVEPPLSSLRVVGLVALVTIVLAFVPIIIEAGASFPTASEGSFSLAEIGVKIVGDYWLVLMALALLLTASLIGALTMAKVEKGGS